MGVGIVARDNEDNVSTSKCASKPYITDPAVAETSVAWLTVEFSQQLGYTNVILEGDSLEVIQALRSEESSWNQYGVCGHLMEDAKNLLHSCQVWRVNHVKREANEIAHRLAKRALGLDEDHVCVCT